MFGQMGRKVGSPTILNLKYGLARVQEPGHLMGGRGRTLVPGGAAPATEHCLLRWAGQGLRSGCLG